MIGGEIKKVEDDVDRDDLRDDYVVEILERRDVLRALHNLTERATWRRERSGIAR